MASALSSETEKDVLPWLKVAEDLRLLRLDCELSMPQICVMGDQSSGKSSVLESLSGIPFPRGSGLVTRCPIRMVMKRARSSEEWSASVSTTLNPHSISARNVNELSMLIERTMQELCGGSSNFSTESVVVELLSPDSCDLTVVDLPGIIRTLTLGQNADSIQQVNKLIRTFLSDPRTIILAVIPANQDIATVDILEMAQKVDPSGERTVGVLTKIDLVDQGGETEILSVVNNSRKPLALGYVMVKNRSQKDISDNVSTATARKLESAFFTAHPIYRKCNPSLYGIDQLSKKLTSLLVERIKRAMIPTKSLVEKMLSVTRSQLRLCPREGKIAKTPADRQKLLVAVIQEFVRHLMDSIRGEYRDRIMVRNPELRMYTVVMENFSQFKGKIHESAPKFEEQDFIRALASQIDQLRGRELPGFMSSQAFYMCMAQYVDRWEEPTLQLLKDVENTAISVSTKLGMVQFAQYPALLEVLRGVAEKVVRDFSQYALSKLHEQIEREKDSFTLNDFLQQWVNKLRFDRFSKAVEDSFSATKNPASNWNGLKEEVFANMRQWYRCTHAISAMASAQEMSAIMEAYWHLSAKRFIDNCCVICDKDVLSKMPEAIQDSMYQFIQDDSLLQSFFMENPETSARRAEIEEKMDRLTQAATKLATISSI